jgi:D-xylose transport system ATP-binding protein
MVGVTPEATAGQPASPDQPVLELVNVSKHFGHVTALDDVSLALYPNAITALVGDNGAGKSTLCSILTGLLHPDEGEVRIRGEHVRLHNPAHAQSLGIATVFQDLALVPERDVAANVFAGRELTRARFFVDRRKMINKTSALIADLKVGLPSPRTKVSELSGGQRQAASIVRTLLSDNVATLLDEPTAALGVRESGRVLELVGQLRKSGQAVMLITHNMDSVFEWCDRVAVMRLGRVRAQYEIHETNRDHLIGMLTGAIVDDPAPKGGRV